MAEQRQTDWGHGLFDCFEDASACCYGFWCFPCFACTVSRKFGENSCLPLCDICSSAAFTACGIPLFVPPAALALRSAMRTRYGIKGSIWKDITTSCCCVLCSWCQMYRELKDRDKVPVVINVQPQTVVNMQPPPVMMMPTIPTQISVVNQPAVVMPAH